MAKRVTQVIEIISCTHAVVVYFLGYFYDRKDKYLNWIADKVELHATVKVRIKSFSTHCTT